jgi:hypothetical protein
LAWRLRIEHFGLEATGDATLIIARQVPPIDANLPMVRSALIDGGRIKDVEALHAFIRTNLGASVKLDVMISTHYDDDHLPGLTELLLKAGTYDDVTIYDQGWPTGNLDDIFLKYLMAINGRKTTGGSVAGLGRAQRTRVTNRVQADGFPPEITEVIAQLGSPAVPIRGKRPAVAGSIDEGPAWMLENGPAELLWDGVGAPAGAPTIRCIAANSFVRTVAGNTGPTALGADPRNNKSLAFEVRFNNFRYYIGGDIETTQENDIQVLLNAANNASGRVVAMKASHHGANTATSRAFVDRMRPEAVFISCGNENSYGHPAVETINVLDGYPAYPQPHQPPPPEPPSRPISHYLTGYQFPDGEPGTGDDTPRSARGALGIAAGDPNAKDPIDQDPDSDDSDSERSATGGSVRGTIRLTVTEAQSNNPATGRIYLGVRQAILSTATYVTLPGAMSAAAAAGPAAAAGEAALSFGIGWTARTVLAQFGWTPDQQQAAVATFNYTRPSKEIAAAITGAAIAAGVPSAIAAAAGAAAGARKGRGLTAAVQASVKAALEQAGIGTDVASYAALAAAIALKTGSGETGQFSVSLYLRGAGTRTYQHM